MGIGWHFNESHCRVDPATLDFAGPEKAAEVLRFHKGMPGYSPTPVVHLSALADRLGLKRLLVKDESRRFGLNAFKALGASYAMAKALAEHLSRDKQSLTFTELAATRGRLQDTTFVTATDGNHGRAVAWAAEKLGCRAVVFMPEGSSSARLEAIRSHGAEASILDMNYDDAVRQAEKMAHERGWILLQDTSWEGYAQVPTWIMQGYMSIITELGEQVPDAWPSHVFAQAGVGSFAAAMLASLCSRAGKRPKPVFTVVEPTGAACFFKSVQRADGLPHRVHGDLPTCMAGLACGEPSLLAWRLLRDCADAFMVCPDEVAKRGMRVLGNPAGEDVRVVSGESGAVTLGLLYELMTQPEHADVREKLKLNQESDVLLISTEGDTDPDMYRRIVWSCA